MDIRLTSGIASKQPVPTQVQKAIGVCESLEDGVGLRQHELAARLGLTLDRFRHYARHAALMPFRIENLRVPDDPARVCYCNKKTKEEYDAG